MSTHIKILGWIRIIYGAIRLLGALGIFAAGLLGGVFSGSLGGLAGSIIGGTVGAIIAGFFGIAAIITGFALIQRQQWARMVVIVLSVIDLLNFPLGTILGIYGLWVLLSSEGSAQFRTADF